MNREPDKTYTIPLWEVNHSQERLRMEERSDWVAFKLGYMMMPTAVDPDAMAYKHFSDEQFPDGNVTEMDYIQSATTAITFDFNRAPQTCAFGQKQGDKYIIFDEVVSKGATTTEQAKRVAERLQKWDISHVELFGDNTSNQKTGRYGRTGKNDWQYVKEVLQEYGITFKSRLKTSNPKRKVRVDKVNNLIYNPLTENRRFLVHSRCKFTIKDYKESITDDEGLKIDSGMIGHISDACDYFLFEMEGNGSHPIYVM